MPATDNPEKNHFTTSQQEIWKTRIRSELSAAKEWEANWGFLLDEREPLEHEEQRSLVKEQVTQCSSLHEAQLVCPAELLSREFLLKACRYDDPEREVRLSDDK